LLYFLFIFYLRHGSHLAAKAAFQSLIAERPLLDEEDYVIAFFAEGYFADMPAETGLAD